MNHTKQTETVKISELKAGPIREDVLPNGFILRLQKVKEILKEVETSSLEKSINNFQRDWHPEDELRIWEAMALRYQEYTEKYPNLSIEEKKNIFSTILLSTIAV